MNYEQFKIEAKEHKRNAKVHLENRRGFNRLAKLYKERYDKSWDKGEEQAFCDNYNMATFEKNLANEDLDFISEKHYEQIIGENEKNMKKRWKGKAFIDEAKRNVSEAKEMLEHCRKYIEETKRRK